MSGRKWSMIERVLLLAVIVFAVLVAVRLANRESTQESHAKPAVTLDATSPPTATEAHLSEPAVGPPPSAAGAELLARIRTCSEKDLAGIIDKLGGVEAYSLYHQLTVADRQAIFAAVPATILANKAHDLLGVPEHYFRRASKPGPLAHALVEAAMGTLSGSAQASRKELSFATAIDERRIPQAPRNTFRVDERKIYACLDSGADPKGESGVLVRWTEEGTGTVVYLHYLPIAANSRWNYVYYEAKNTWNPGSYRVCLYRLGVSVSLLAEGTYVVRKGD